MLDGLSQQIEETLILYEMKTPGFIHKDAVPKLLEDLGIMLTPAELVKVQTAVSSGANPKGLIPRGLISEAVDPILRRLNAEKLAEFIGVFDRDKDGKISAEDFDYAVVNFGKGLKENEIKHIHSLIGDKDPIDISELAKALMS